jgi:uncharacterized protein YgfB (UPF0149 family)
VVDFDGLANELFEQGWQVSPSEVHGCLSGALAAGAETSGEAALLWLQRCLSIEPVGDLAGAIIALYEWSASSLASEDLAFALLLPDETFDIEARVIALGDWSRGFVSTYAQVLAAKPAAERDLCADSSELLKDMAVIAQAAADEDEDEDALDDQLYEIAEYLRVAAMNIYLDTVTEADEPSAAATPDTLH